MEPMNRMRGILAAACAATLLGACGGGSSSSGPTTSGSGGSNASAANVLFVSDAAGAIVGFPTLTVTPGQTLKTHVLVMVPAIGSQIAYDAVRDELYATQIGLNPTFSEEIQVFAHASTMAPGTTPSRTIVLPAFAQLFTLQLDTASDTLWVGGIDTNTLTSFVGVFAHASTLSGGVAPTRSLTFLPFLTVDAKRHLIYVEQGSDVLVYEDAPTLSGFPTPAKVISNVGSGETLQPSVDATRDILYVPAGQSIMIVHNASAASPGPIVSLALPVGSATSAIVDAAHDRLYVAAGSTAYVFENASALTASSTVPAASVQVPDDTVSSFAF